MVLRPHSPQSRGQQLAQRKALQDEAFFREVDEAVRHDDMAAAFRRYALPIAIGVALVLVALAGFLYWQRQRAEAAARRGETLVQALDDAGNGRLADADASLAPLAGDSGGAGAVARLARAAIAEQQGRAADAAGQFEGVANDAKAPQPLRDLATVRAVAASFDTIPPARVVARLKPLAVPGSPWFGNAGELLGMAYLKLNQPALAGPLFVAIARDKDTPQSLRRRAGQIAGLLGYDAVDDVAQATQDDPAQ